MRLNFCNLSNYSYVLVRPTMEFGNKTSKVGGSASTRRSGAGMTHRDRRARIKVGDGTKVLGGRPNYELEEAFPCVASVRTNTYSNGTV